VVFRASSTIEWGQGESVAWVGVRIGPEAGAPEDMALEGLGDRNRCGTGSEVGLATRGSAGPGTVLREGN
jgi:hypothetical protein